MICYPHHDILIILTRRPTFLFCTGLCEWHSQSWQLHILLEPSIVCISENIQCQFLRPSSTGNTGSGIMKLQRQCLRTLQNCNCSPRLQAAERTGGGDFNLDTIEGSYGHNWGSVKKNKTKQRNKKTYLSASYLTSGHSHCESTQGTCWNKERSLTAKLPGSARLVKSTQGTVFLFVLSLMGKVLETGVGRALEWCKGQNPIQLTFHSCLGSWQLQKSLCQVCSSDSKRASEEAGPWEAQCVVFSSQPQGFLMVPGSSENVLSKLDKQTSSASLAPHSHEAAAGEKGQDALSSVEFRRCFRLGVVRRPCAGEWKKLNQHIPNFPFYLSQFTAFLFTNLA